MHLFMQRGPVSAHEGLWHPSMRLGHASHFERSVRLCLWLGAASLFRTDMNNVNYLLTYTLVYTTLKLHEGKM